MSRCELHNITQVTSVAQPQTKKDEVEKTVPSDADKVSIQAILKDLRYCTCINREIYTYNVFALSCCRCCFINVE